MTVTDTLEAKILQDIRSAVAELLLKADINEFKEAVVEAVTTLNIETEDGTLVIELTKS